MLVGWIATASLAYLLGSIPFGLLLVHLAGMGDIRKIGSGSIGATNVLRTGKRGLAAATLLLDGGKGALAVLIAAHFGEDPALIAAVAAVIGHLFPVWLGFSGGKGVATAAGVMLVLAPWVALVACAVWLATAVITRYSSLAGIVAVSVSPGIALLLADSRRAIVALILAVLVVYRHKGNIARLMSGQESRIRLGGSSA